MKLKKMILSRGKKLSHNYNSYDYHVGVEIELEPKDTFATVYDIASELLTEMEVREAKRIMESIEPKKTKKMEKDDDF